MCDSDEPLLHFLLSVCSGDAVCRQFLLTCRNHGNQRSEGTNISIMLQSVSLWPCMHPARVVLVTDQYFVLQPVDRKCVFLNFSVKFLPQR